MKNTVVPRGKKILNPIWQRSLLRERQYPSRINAWRSLLFLVMSIPLAICLFPILAIRFSTRPLVVHVLVCEAEFGHLIRLLEYARKKFEIPSQDCLVVIQAKYSHATFGFLYQESIKPRILWSKGVKGLYAQALLLQPQSIVLRQFHLKRDADASEFPTQPLELSPELKELGSSLTQQLGLKSSTLVLLSVHTKEYDEARTPEAQHKDWILETNGSDLVVPISFLNSRRIDIVRVGGRDTGQAHIPLNFPRIEEFARMGSGHEVVLASACTYFWADDDGGWWSSAPFKKPVLFTNIARFQLQRNYYPGYCIHVPTLFQRLDGTILTFRDMMQRIVSGSAPYKAAARGELRIIRNSPLEICDAHSEMLARIRGHWRASEHTQYLRGKISKIWREFPEFDPPNFPESFLLSHSDLLD